MKKLITASLLSVLFTASAFALPSEDKYGSSAVKAIMNSSKLRMNRFLSISLKESENLTYQVKSAFPDGIFCQDFTIENVGNVNANGEEIVISKVTSASELNKCK